MRSRRYKNQSEFGKRLKIIRQAKGLTQEELAKKIGGTQKMITHYENRVKFPPVEIIPKLARALKVTTDELLGLKPVKDGYLAENKNLMKRFNDVGNLPLRDQRTIFSMINSLRFKRSSKQAQNNS